MKHLPKIVMLVFLAATNVVAQKKPNILLCIADDWSLHAGVYGDNLVKTPNIDKVAKNGVVFKNAFCAAPSCSPSRAAILTGRYPHQLEEGGNLWGILPAKYPNYTQILEKNGYNVGRERKGWGPGNFEAGGYNRNPAGNAVKNFEEFWQKHPKGTPFCYWFGTPDPHRPYTQGTGSASGMNPNLVKVPAWLPNTPEVQNDILDYYYEIQRFDQELGEIIEKLRQNGELDNTIIVITGDNGMPFPRAKATVYDGGSNVPLIIAWKNHIKPRSQIVNTFVSLLDLAPTFLAAAALPIPAEMTGKSLMPFLENKSKIHRNEVFIERERHANVRKGDKSYPVRAIRTKEFLYIRNYDPDQYPAGDPKEYFAVGDYGDVDDSPSKKIILDDTLTHQRYFQLAFVKRPAEELYDLRNDPEQLNNIADKANYKKQKHILAQKLTDWMKTTQDPRFEGKDPFSSYKYYGNAARTKPK
jgi:N-sulfoglucosamine sulfohydrolase